MIADNEAGRGQPWQVVVTGDMLMQVGACQPKDITIMLPVALTMYQSYAHQKKSARL
jgi:hypothetical protein